MIVSVIALVFSLGGGACAASAFVGPLNPSAPAVSSATTVRLHPLKLVNGWKSAARTAFNSGGPSYAVSNGVVYLSGGIYQPRQGKAEFAVLPRGARPATNVFITVSIDEGLANFGTLFISPKGVMEVYVPSAAGTPASDFSSLAGVSFPLGS
jgi:hypothetical protein